MVLKIFTVLDAKTKLYTQPFFRVSHGQAERDFKDEINNPQSLWGKHPEDYSLYHLGEFDEASAGFHTAEAQLITTGLQVLDGDVETGQ